MSENTKITIDTVGIGINWSLGETYRVAVDPGFMIGGGDLQIPFDGRTNFLTFSTPNNPPQISTTNPMHTGTANIGFQSISFNIDRKLLTVLGGNAYLYKQGSPNALIKTYAINSTNTTGNVVTIPIVGNIQASSTYFVTADANIFLDRDGFKNNAITNNSSFRFTSPNTPQLLSVRHDFSEATGNANLQLRFDRVITSADSGILNLYTFSSNTLIGSYSTGSNTRIENGNLIVEIGPSLSDDVTYYFNANANIIQDSTLIKNTAISNTSDWRFINQLSVPNTPIFTVTSTGLSTANISFIKPYNGGNGIISYTAISNPGNIITTINQHQSGNITITNLSEESNYTFRMYATNSVGNSDTSSQSSTIATYGRRAYFEPGTAKCIDIIGGSYGIDIIEPNQVDESWTWEGWFYNVDTNANNRALFDTRKNYVSESYPYVNTSGFAFRQNSTNEWVFVSNVIGDITVSGRSNNTWHHIAIVTDHISNTLRCYVDGTKKFERAAVTMQNNRVRIGAFFDNADVSDYSFNGYIDDIRISKVARYSGNTVSITGSTDNDSDTKVLLKFDTAIGSNIILDSSDHYNMLSTGTNFPIIVATPGRAVMAGIVQPPPTTPPDNASVYFPGSPDGSALTVPAETSSPALGSGAFTLEGWFYPTGSNNEWPLFDTRSSSGSNGVLLRFDDTDGRNGFALFAGSSTPSFVTSGADYWTPNTWQHIALVRGNGAKLYVNGTLIASGAANGNYSERFLRLGGFADDVTSPTALYHGYMDSIRISNVERYLNNFTPPTAPFASDARTFFLLQGNTIVDSSSYNNSITVGGNVAISTTQYKF